jgi:prepilin-type N-terminal cleavage/methylation domain-containing protein
MLKLTSHPGFSLVELALVISIIGVLTVITLPRVASVLENIREKAVSERIVEDINYLRNYAISRHDTTWLVVDLAQNSYGMYTGPSAGTRTPIPDPETSSTDPMDLDVEYPGVTISSATFGAGTEVSFNFWGTPSSGGSIVLNSRTITLVAETGMAHETP